MKKVIILLALLALSVGTFSCGGGGAGSANVPPGENPGIPSVVQLLPSHNIAQTNAIITLHTKVLDGNGKPVPNTPVIFTNLSPIGVLSSTGANTDSSGLATVTLTSTTTGFSTVQAEVNTGAGQIRNRKTVFFSLFDMTLPSPPSPPAPSLTINVDDGDGIPDEDDDFNLFKIAGDNQRTITAVVLNSSRNPVSGSLVTFGADSTEASFPLGSTKTTNSSGEASVLLQVDPSILRTLITTLNITASADNGAANMVSLFIQPVIVNNITVFANRSTVDSGGTSAITAAVFLNTGTLTPDGTTVNFRTCDATCATCDTTCATTCGSIEPFAQTTNGVAPATFTAPSTSGTCTVGANIGLISGQTDVLVKAAALTVTPSTVSVTGVAGTGDNVTFHISGGSGTYTGVFSNNTAVIPNPTITGNNFTINPNVVATSTSVTLTVTDSLGATGTATVTVTPATSTIALNPSSITVDSTAGTITFNIIGGVSTFDVFTSNIAVVTVGGGVKINDLGPNTFDAQVVGAGSATITVVDSDAKTVTATVTVTAPPAPPTPPAIGVIPNSGTVIGIDNPPAGNANGGCPPDGNSADDFTAFISGGTPPYFYVSSNNLAVIPACAVTISGSNLTIDPDSVGASTSVIVVIRDNAAVPQTATITVTVTP